MFFKNCISHWPSIWGSHKFTTAVKRLCKHVPKTTFVIQEQYHQYLWLSSPANSSGLAAINAVTGTEKVHGNVTRFLSIKFPCVNTVAALIQNNFYAIKGFASVGLHAMSSSVHFKCLTLLTNFNVSPYNFLPLYERLHQSLALFSSILRLFLSALSACV